MKTKINIAIVAGGDSSEYVVSVRSSANVYSAIDRKKFTPWLVSIRNGNRKVLENDQEIAPIDKSDFSFVLNGTKVQLEYAYIMIHGTPGEDGNLQGYFEMLGIPYSSSGVQSSALTFNKNFCNNYLRSFRIRMAASQRTVQGENLDVARVVKELGLPL